MSEAAKLAEIHNAFSMMESMTNDVIRGKTTKNFVVIPGPGGIGKTFLIEKLLKAYDPDYDSEKGMGRKVKRVTSKITAPRLHRLYYEYKDPGCVLFFDDVAGIETDDAILNKFKAATDTRDVRVISHDVTQKGGDDDTPPSFGAQTITIIATNVDWDKKIQMAKGKAQSSMAEHLKALSTRARIINLFKVFQTMEDCILRLKDLIDQGMLDKFPVQVRKDVFNYIKKNARGDVCKIRELSGRIVGDLADLRLEYGTDWERYAEFATFD